MILLDGGIMGPGSTILPGPVYLLRASLHGTGPPVSLDLTSSSPSPTVMGGTAKAATIKSPHQRLARCLCMFCLLPTIITDPLPFYFGLANKRASSLRPRTLTCPLVFFVVFFVIFLGWVVVVVVVVVLWKCVCEESREPPTLVFCYIADPVLARWHGG